MQIYKFNSILKPVLWGGDKLAAFKGLSSTGEPIGESWELSAVPGWESVVADGPDQGLTLSQLLQRYKDSLVGEEVYQRYGDQFPLLIKLIDAKRDLSVQVHPGDELAQRRHGCAGKNEMWYVLETDEGAHIRTGFNRPMSSEELERRLADGTLLDVINSTESRPGDIFYIPAGQIHSIGAGNLLAEIQQSSDITYRVWDYGRRDAAGNLRQLHLQEAREALDYAPRNCHVDAMPTHDPCFTRVVACDKFCVYRLDVDGCYTHVQQPGHSFVALVCIDGEVTVQFSPVPAATLSRGETALVPAISGNLHFEGKASLLMAMVPPLR